MTEEQFWNSNPRLIQVWENAWKEEQKYNNQLTYAMAGNYYLSAMQTALSQVIQPMLCGRRSQAKYISEPIQLFPLTEEEKKQKQEAAIRQFAMWAGSLEKKFGKEE